MTTRNDVKLISSLSNYVQDVKPFHVKLKEFLSELRVQADTEFNPRVNVTVRDQVRFDDVASEEVSCDCSHIAWMTGFETEGESMMDIGDGEVSVNDDGEGAGRTPPLWQAGSLFLGFNSADEVQFTNPAVPVSNVWTLRFSMKAPAGAYVASDAYLFRIFDNLGQDVASILVDNADSEVNSFKFFLTIMGTTTISQPYPYDQLHNVELNFVNGEFATVNFYVNGAPEVEGWSVYSSLGLIDSITNIRMLRPGYNYNGQATWFDEVRFQNIIEHTSEHVVDDLPFCRCT